MRLLPAVLLVAGLVSASPGRAAGIQRLGAETTIPYGAGNLTALVSVPKDVDFGSEASFSDGSVSVTGKADVVMAFLVRQGDSQNTTFPFTFGVLPQQTGHEVFVQSPGRVLRRGTYRLELAHTSGAGTLTIRLPGLVGKVQLSGLMPGAAFVASRGVGAIGPGGVRPPVAGSGLVGHPLTRRGLIVGGIQLRASAPGVREEICLQNGDGSDQATAPVAGNPGCLGADVDVSQTIVGQDDFFQLGARLNLDAGTYSVGWAYESASIVTAAAGFMAWVPTA